MCRPGCAARFRSQRTNSTAPPTSLSFRSRGSPEPSAGSQPSRRASAVSSLRSHFSSGVARRPAALLPEVILEDRSRGEQRRFQSTADHDAGRTEGASVCTAGTCHPLLRTGNFGLALTPAVHRAHHDSLATSTAHDLARDGARNEGARAWSKNMAHTTFPVPLGVV